MIHVKSGWSKLYDFTRRRHAEPSYCTMHHLKEPPPHLQRLKQKEEATLKFDHLVRGIACLVSLRAGTALPAFCCALPSCSMNEPDTKHLRSILKRDASRAHLQSTLPSSCHHTPSRMFVILLTTPHRPQPPPICRRRPVRRPRHRDGEWAPVARGHRPRTRGSCEDRT